MDDDTFVCGICGGAYYTRKQLNLVNGEKVCNVCDKWVDEIKTARLFADWDEQHEAAVDYWFKLTNNADLC